MISILKKLMIIFISSSSTTISLLMRTFRVKLKETERAVPLWDTSHIQVHSIDVQPGSQCTHMQVFENNGKPLVAMIYRLPNDDIQAWIFDPNKDVSFMVKPDLSNRTAYDITDH